MTLHIHWREPISWTLEHPVLNARRLPAYLPLDLTVNTYPHYGYTHCQLTVRERGFYIFRA
jgi:hypothetical protein